MSDFVGVKLTTTSPFHYGHLMVSGGVATIPEVINDRAVLFALAAAAGMMAAKLVLPAAPDYRGHLDQLPWRASFFTTERAKLLRPIARRSDLGIEGGYQDRVRRAAASGNFKEYFTIQEVPPFQEFTGILTGPDPFELLETQSICLRIGSGRNGTVLMERAEVPTVKINCATAKLFGRDLTVERLMLNAMAASKVMPSATAADELTLWK